MRMGGGNAFRSSGYLHLITPIILRDTDRWSCVDLDKILSRTSSSCRPPEVTHPMHTKVPLSVECGVALTLTA